MHSVPGYSKESGDLVGRVPLQVNRLDNRSLRLRQLPDRMLKTDDERIYCRLNFRFKVGCRKGDHPSTLYGASPMAVDRDTSNPLDHARGVFQLVSLRPTVGPGSLSAFLGAVWINAEFSQDRFGSLEASNVCFSVLLSCDCVSHNHKMDQPRLKRTEKELKSFSAL
jgi:hypothetical protein